MSAVAEPTIDPTPDENDAAMRRTAIEEHKRQLAAEVEARLAAEEPTPAPADPDASVPVVTLAEVILPLGGSIEIIAEVVRADSVELDRPVPVRAVAHLGDHALLLDRDGLDAVLAVLRTAAIQRGLLGDAAERNPEEATPAESIAADLEPDTVGGFAFRVLAALHRIADRMEDRR